MTNFKKCREMSGRTQTEVAKLAGVSCSTVSQLEKKGCFDTRVAVKYGKAMRCNPLFLLDGLNSDPSWN